MSIPKRKFLLIVNYCNVSFPSSSLILSNTIKKEIIAKHKATVFKIIFEIFWENFLLINLK